MDQPDRPTAPLGRMMARLDPESKRLLAAGLVGYVLCLWQAFCTMPPWPALDPPRRDWLVDQAGPGVNPAVARELLLNALRSDCPVPGEVVAAIDLTFVISPIDLEAASAEGPEGWTRNAELSLRGKSRAVLRPTPTWTMACFLAPQGKTARTLHTPPPGHLAAKFESGADGAASVGFTPSAGTSYGTFQIAAGTPTFANFLRYLKERAPDLHDRLAGKGPADTGSTRGGVPEEWRRIAGEHAKRFERLQYEFIVSTHYRPALSAIQARTGLDASILSPASREVLLSTAVQHGPGGAADIYEAAVAAIRERVVEERRVVLFEKALIEEVYRERLKAFGNAPLVGRGAMISRFGREKSQALGLVERHYSGS